MITILNKLCSSSKNFSSLHLKFKKIKEKTEIEKIFKAVEQFSDTSEIRYVGGCVRKIINNELVEDIDLAVNLSPSEVSKVLKKNNIKSYETGIEHGTITALINQNKFEITSLRKDVLTDGRHAKVEFSNDWYEDASRRDFSINSIYADIDGNLFDPFEGKKDLENGEVKFIGDAEKRIKEDYLRALRYVRFFLNYSKKNHSINVIKAIKQNLNGFSKISPERLLDEFKKLIRSEGFFKLTKDKFCFEIINLIFPQFKNIGIFKKLNDYARENIHKLDFIILISLMIIDGTDNVKYFLYKFNLSKNDQKRILFLSDFFSKTIAQKFFFKQNLWRILYLNGKQPLMDLLYFEIFKSKKINKKLIELIEFFEDKKPPIFPIKAKGLMEQYKIPEGKELGLKLKKIEEKWIENNFKISNEEIKKLIIN